MAFNVGTLINRDDDLWQTLHAWPKIELHRHLEGSIRLRTLIEVAREFDIALPAYSVDELRPYVQMTDDDEPTSKVFLSKFDMLRKFYCSLDTIRRITHEAVKDAARDNVRYMELRFTPYALAQQNHYDYREVMAIVAEEADAAAAEAGIRVRLIVSVNRHESVQVAETVLNGILELNIPTIVAMDLAGRESDHSALPFREVFARAKAAGLAITIHAGEWGGPDNVREAILEMGADRIGHGVRVVEDSRVVQLVRERQVTLEVCPTSNLHTGVVTRLEHHPLIDLCYLKAMTTINTDDPSLSDITLTDELALAHIGLGLPLAMLKANILNAARAAFLPPDERDALVSEFRTALGLDDTLLRRPR